MFKPDENYLNAVKALRGMEKEGVQRALEAVLAMRLLAVQTHKKDVAIEMTHMKGEIVKEMLRRLVEANGEAPAGLTLEEGLVKIGENVQDEVNELEAA